ncbi:MAG TPA: hypothetical protein PLQ32_02945 [Flavihumibacter sp.]|nr:cytochrome c [Bacteroidota bacterium]HOA36766.1 hypothetical protein [Flavihumibacter sp.]HPZ87033.1 hypothetical protein [Flavihumibacter sp.]HQD09193.1 hypothetical protein [Flavihumibacter sp.]
MRRYIILSFFLFVVLAWFTACKTEYAFPQDIPPSVHPDLIQRFKKGKVLYKIHCTECHGIYAKGHLDVPNFTEYQIDFYSREALLNPAAHTVMRKISNEQLNMIILFLRYRRDPPTKTLKWKL